MATVDLNSINDFDHSYNINCYTCASLEDCKKFLDMSYNIKLLTFNIRSINRNTNTFLVALKRLDTNFDVIILTECWVETGAKPLTIPGYSSYYTTKNTNKCGGVVAYIANKWNPTITEISFNEAEYIKLEESLIILGIYRSPSFKKLDNFFTFLGNTFKSLHNNNVVLTRDINIDLLDAENSDTVDYLCLLSEAGFRPAITLPTRYKSCLDHIFIFAKTKYSSLLGLVAPTDVTDHDFSILCISGGSLKKYPLDRYFTKIDYPSVLSDLEQADWSSVINSTDVSQALNNF